MRSWSEYTRTHTVHRQDALVLTLSHIATIGNPLYPVKVGGAFTIGSTTAGHYGNPCVT